MKTNREIALEHAINTAHLSGAKSVIERATEYLAFLNESQLVPAAPGIKYQYFRKVRNSSGRPILDGDTYRVPTGASRGVRAEYLNEWDGDKTWIECASTTVGEVYDGFNASTHDRVAQP